MTTPVVAPRSGLNPPRAPAPTPPRHRSNLQEKNKNQPPRAIHSVVARRRMTTPVVNTHPRHRSNLQEKNKNQPPRAIHSVVARRRMTTPVVNTPPDTGAIPKEKKRRHSGIFRVADLGPGTMPRGKYPESPARAGSHALISRTPPPGGMLHANLGLPRPPPRNFQPPLPQQPPKQTQQRRH